MDTHTHIHTHTDRTTTVTVLNSNSSSYNLPPVLGIYKNKMEIIYNNYNYDAGCEVV